MTGPSSGVYWTGSGDECKEGPGPETLVRINYGAHAPSYVDTGTRLCNVERLRVFRMDLGPGIEYGRDTGPRTIV